MNNERYNQIIDEAYKNYADSHWTPPSNPKGKLLSDQLWGLIPMQHNKDSFIHEIKTNPKFSERWGLKIEERELSLEERGQWCEDFLDWDLVVPNLDHDHIREDVEENAPTKLITITYKNEKTEVYE